jgi:hypothetical protein|nr:MAG TPA: Minor capsid protein [Caudoviricetes sp.]
MKITLKIKVIKGREFKVACTAAEAVVATQALKDTTPYVPALTGAFSNLARVDGNEIVYTGDQAAYLYAGKVMVDEMGRHAVYIKDVGWRHRKGAKLHAIDKDLVFTTDMHPKAQAHWMEASYEENAEKWALVGERAVKLWLE